MWRYDAGRTAVTPHALAETLHLQWTRQLPAPAPAFRNERLRFDAGYEPVVMGKQLFVGSARTDSVTAYDTDTGEERWRFYADGPVRCAPVAANGRVYFGSDDGCVYCLDAEQGRVIWRVRAVPSNRTILGNGRLISVWPIRGGPVLVNGTLYFAAGVWPLEGTFIYALEAVTGKVVWLNDRGGFVYGRQPHNAVAIGGISPQGYLFVNGDDLVVPCGTAYPATLDRHTGEIKSFELPSDGRLPGGWFASLDARRGKVAFDSSVNREQHEDKMNKGRGTDGVSRTISVGGRVLRLGYGSTLLFRRVAGSTEELHSAAATARASGRQSDPAGDFGAVRLRVGQRLGDGRTIGRSDRAEGDRGGGRRSAETSLGRCRAVRHADHVDCR